MAERQVSVENRTYRLKPPFFVIATQNPVEHEGTFALPEAQLDRFLMRLSLGYPNADAEEKMLEEGQRATQGLYRACQASAAIAGRQFVLPDWLQWDDQVESGLDLEGRHSAFQTLQAQKAARSLPKRRGSSIVPVAGRLAA